MAGSDFDIVDGPVEILTFLKSNDADKGDILAAVDDIEINANSVLNLNVDDANVLATNNVEHSDLVMKSATRPVLYRAKLFQAATSACWLMRRL